MRNLIRFKVAVVFGISILIAVATRFFMLGDAPAGIYVDEAAQGWNAYSILLTGRDEFGKSFPIVFRSFIDFKTPVYIYLLVPLIAIFDLTIFTVRLPSFIFSLLTIPFLYLLIRDFSPKKIGVTLGLVTVFLLSFSPWHVLFGRTDFETNVALFFLISGFYFFYRALSKPKWFSVAAILLGVAVPAYHSQRVITPLLLMVLSLRYRKQIFNQKGKSYLIAALILGVLVSLPTIYVMATPGFLARASGLNIISAGTPYGYISDVDGLIGAIVNFKYLLWFQEFFSLYIAYLTPRNMFNLGDFGPRSSFPDIATYFVWQLPFYVYGLYILVKEKSLGELRIFTIAFLLIGPIPAALTRDPYASIRALPLVIPQLIVIALGMIYLYKYFRLSRFSLVIHLFGIAVVIYSLAKLWSSAIILNEHYRGYYWDYGWEQVVQVIKSFDDELPIVIDNNRFEPYAQILLFLKHDPATYQRDNFEVHPDQYYTSMSRVRDKKIGKITTREINWGRDLMVEQYLIGDELAISKGQIAEHQLHLIREVLYPNGDVAYRIVKTN